MSTNYNKVSVAYVAFCTYLSSSGLTVVQVAQVENSQHQVGKVQVFVEGLWITARVHE